MAMEKWLITPYFKYFIVPLFIVGFNIFLKFVSRNDQHAAFKKEDLSVGLQIAVTAFILYITYAGTMAERIISLSKDATNPDLLNILRTRFMMVPWIITAFLLGLWGISTLVRKLGWKDQDNLTVFFGIVIPFIYGMLCLIFVVSWIG